jgi:anti-anti-sigma factor
MKCSILSQMRNANSIITISGSVSGEDAGKLSEELSSINKQNINRVIIDLSKTMSMDSSTVGILVYWWKLMEQEHKALFLYKPHEIISEMLETTNLDKLLPIVDSFDNLDA